MSMEQLALCDYYQAPDHPPHAGHPGWPCAGPPSVCRPPARDGQPCAWPPAACRPPARDGPTIHDRLVGREKPLYIVGPSLAGGLHAAGLHAAGLHTAGHPLRVTCTRVACTWVACTWVACTRTAGLACLL